MTRMTRLPHASRMARPASPWLLPLIFLGLAGPSGCAGVGAGATAGAEAAAGARASAAPSGSPGATPCRGGSDPLASDAERRSGSVERVDRVRDTYSAGMERVLRAAATDRRTAAYWPLRGIGEFWRGSVAWAEATGGGYRPLEPQRSGAGRPARGESGEPARPGWPGRQGPRGWVAVVPANLSLSPGRGPLLQVEPARGGDVIRIRPERVTEAWAGLFLVHELAHLADRVLWGETSWRSRHHFLEAELRAVELEFAAATAISGGALPRHLDAALAAMRPGDMLELLDRTLDLTDAALDALVPPDLDAPPASPAERVLRHQFLRAALVLRYGTIEELHREMVLFGLDTLLRAGE